VGIGNKKVNGGKESVLEDLKDEVGGAKKEKKEDARFRKEVEKRKPVRKGSSRKKGCCEDRIVQE